MDLTQRLAIWAIPVVFAIVVHEVAHGWAALHLGDSTAKSMGRLSLNPLTHIDPIGSLLVPAVMLLLPGGFLFGWAKPVPVNPARLKQPRRDMVFVALAGPFANLMMLLLWAFITKTGLLLGGIQTTTGYVLIHMGVAGIFINAVLMMLNLLPIPPLDGSKVVEGLLPVRQAITYNKLGQYGFPILILLMVTGVLGVVLWPMITLALTGGSLAAAIPGEVLNFAFYNLFGLTAP
ncbi:site-2 protease family protein [Granulosicoccaceae sp. 1_MG-2023]|nr:site-2 protease family protein [Granulosicoccaceae sp. 1_MG-2023]